MIDWPRQQHVNLRPTMALAVACALLVTATLRAAEKGDASRDFHRPLKSLASARTLLGEGWFEAPDGLVIENTKDLSALTPKERSVAEGVARAMISEKVVAVGDFSFTRKDVPRIVTVRIYVFEDAAAAQAFWKKQQEMPGWQQHYEKMTGLGDAAFKSIKARKESVLKNNVWLTSHQLHEGDDFHRVLVHYLDQIGSEPKAAKKP